MDRDLMDVTVDRLHSLYREHRYTVTRVVQWHLDRIARYNGIYRAVQTVTAKAALAKPLAKMPRRSNRASIPGFFGAYRS